MFKLFIFACFLALAAAKPGLLSSVAYTAPVAAAYSAPLAAYTAPAYAAPAYAASAYTAPLAYSAYSAPYAPYSAYSYASPYASYYLRR